MSEPTDRRAAFTAGLRALADFLDANPGVPLPYLARLSHHPDGSDAQQRAEVDRIAAVLGVTPTTSARGTHYAARRSWGPITYEAVAITEAHMDRYEAHMRAFRHESEAQS